MPKIGSILRLSFLPFPLHLAVQHETLYCPLAHFDTPHIRLIELMSAQFLVLLDSGAKVILCSVDRVLRLRSRNAESDISEAFRLWTCTLSICTDLDETRIHSNNSR